MSKIQSIKGYENLREVLGEELGQAIYDHVDKSEQQDEADLTFLLEIQEHLGDSKIDYVETMLRDWIHELIQKING